MKKEFVSPKLEACEFVVAARLSGSGAHDNGGGNGSACLVVASSGGNSCAPPSSPNSTVDAHGGCRPK